MHMVDQNSLEDYRTSFFLYSPILFTYSFVNNPVLVLVN